MVPGADAFYSSQEPDVIGLVFGVSFVFAGRKGPSQLISPNLDAFGCGTFRSWRQTLQCTVLVLDRAAVLVVHLFWFAG